jgi:3-phenylpropionate/trans-cinnamate dioxygenase ferredoxin component
LKIAISDLIENKPIRVEVDGQPVCVVKIGSEVFAIGDTCSHSDASLSEGEVSEGLIECWLHGAQFDLRTGAAVTPPAVSPVDTFKVQNEDGFVSITKGEK